jgi:hypothetical protein
MDEEALAQEVETGSRGQSPRLEAIRDERRQRLCPVLSC